jgi:hypothetical protein
MALASRLLAELGGKDAKGRPTLNQAEVEIKDGYTVCP